MKNEFVFPQNLSQFTQRRKNKEEGRKCDYSGPMILYSLCFALEGSVLRVNRKQRAKIGPTVREHAAKCRFGRVTTFKHARCGSKQDGTQHVPQNLGIRNGTTEVQRLSIVCSTSEVGYLYPLWNIQNLGAVRVQG